jgi:hypothetical protein
MDHDEPSWSFPTASTSEYGESITALAMTVESSVSTPPWRGLAVHLPSLIIGQRIDGSPARTFYANLHNGATMSARAAFQLY